MITNTINGRKYIGTHTTINPMDSYMGSGKYIKQAIQKYGKEHFVKTILFDYDNRQDMLDKEKELVNDEWIKKNYNATTGGRGIGCIVFLTPNHPKRQDVCKKISFRLTGKIRTQAMKDHQRLIKTGTTNLKNQENMAQDWIITKPDGVKVIIRNLAKYCKDNGLQSSCMRRVATGERLHHKFYRCRKHSLVRHKSKCSSILR